MTNAHAVLVVVDVQNGFISEYSKPVVPAIVDLVSRWQDNGGDTIFTHYVNYPGSPFERLMGWTGLRGRPETDTVDELSPYVARATYVVDKEFYSLFNEEGSALIRKHGWSDLYICGIDTECCVLKTAVDAFERNLTPWVLADACASHSGQETHDAGLLVTRTLIGPGQVITTDDIASHVLPAKQLLG